MTYSLRANKMPWQPKCVGEVYLFRVALPKRFNSSTVLSYEVLNVPSYVGRLLY